MGAGWSTTKLLKPNTHLSQGARLLRPSSSDRVAHGESMRIDENRSGRVTEVVLNVSHLGSDKWMVQTWTGCSHATYPELWWSCAWCLWKGKWMTVPPLMTCHSSTVTGNAPPNIRILVRAPSVLSHLKVFNRTQAHPTTTFIRQFESGQV